MTILPIIIGVAILVAAFALISRRRTALLSTALDLQVGMKGVAAEAVELAGTHYNTSLDYSPESVALVESNILKRLHEEHSKEAFPLAREKEEAWRWGAYVGEVILRLAPGHWEVDHVAGGPDRIRLSWRVARASRWRGAGSASSTVRRTTSGTNSRSFI